MENKNNRLKDILSIYLSICALALIFWAKDDALLSFLTLGVAWIGSGVILCFERKLNKTKDKAFNPLSISVIIVGIMLVAVSLAVYTLTKAEIDKYSVLIHCIGCFLMTCLGGTFMWAVYIYNDNIPDKWVRFTFYTSYSLTLMSAVAFIVYLID